MTTHTTLTSAEFFAGIGGFIEGFGRAGIETKLAVEIDPHCNTVLNRQYPDILKREDIHDVKGSDIGKVDIFSGGFPCQDTCIAAPSRLGLAGSRSGNFVEFARVLQEYLRLVDELSPRFVVIENPVGLLTSPGIPGKGSKAYKTWDGVDRTGWDMAAVARGLEDLGYGWAYRMVDGRYLGSTQKRERIIVVGHRGGDPRPAWQVLADEGAGEGPAPARTQRWGEGGPRADRSADPSGTLIWRKSARARASLAKGGYETWPAADFANTLTGRDGGLPNNQQHIVLQDGRLRTFTLTEWERLQGFPDGWTEGIPESARFRALGNAMHVGMAEWLGHRIKTVHAALPQIDYLQEVTA